jgi:hypothetical protein
MPTIIQSSDFNASELLFTPFKKYVNKTTGKKSHSTYLNCKSASGPIAFQTPFLQAPFGARSFVNSDDGNQKTSYSLNVAAKECNILNLGDDKRQAHSQDSIDAYFDEWRSFEDETLVDFAIKNSKIIFGKKYSEKQREVVKVLVTSIVKNSDDEKYPARLAPKFVDKYENKKSTGKPNVTLYSMTNEENPSITRRTELTSYDDLVEFIPKGSYVSLILKPKFWIVNKKCGVSLIVDQILKLETGGGKGSDFGFFNFGSVSASSATTTSTSEETAKADTVSDEGDEAEEDEAVVDDDDDDDDDSDDDDSDDDDDDSEEE